MYNIYTYKLFLLLSEVDDSRKEQLVTIITLDMKEVDFGWK